MNTSCNIDCEKTIKASEGLMRIFDYPVTHQYELTYKMKIEVPKGHSIDLMFSKQNQEFNDTSRCESCKPYIEILHYDSSGEPYFRIDRIDDISKSTNVSIPHYKVDIRFFSGLNWNKSQSLRNNKYFMSFKAVSNEERWTILRVLPIILPLGFIISGVACFWAIIKKKPENNSQETQILPISIHDDQINQPFQIQISKQGEKENIVRGLRLRTQNSSNLEEKRKLTVVSSFAEAEAPDMNTCPEHLITPLPGGMEGPKRYYQRKIPSKVNLLNRYSRSALSTPRYGNLKGQASCVVRLSRSEDIDTLKKNSIKDDGTKFFKFEIPDSKDDATIQPELETSVFLTSTSGTPGSEGFEVSVPDLPFLSPKEDRKF